MDVVKLIEGGANITLAIKLEDLRLLIEQLTIKTPKPLEIEELISADRVCEILDTDRVTLWRWAKSGYLRPIKIGGANKYRKRDIINLTHNDNGE